MKTICGRLKSYIEDLGFTEKEFAEKVGMTYENLYAYTHDKRQPGSEVLLRFYKVGIDLNWLVGGKQIKENKELQEIKKIMRKYGIVDKKELNRKLQINRKINALINEN